MAAVWDATACTVDGTRAGAVEAVPASGADLWSSLLTINENKSEGSQNIEKRTDVTADFGRTLDVCCRKMNINWCFSTTSILLRG
jgi:hypothetical protein